MIIRIAPYPGTGELHTERALENLPPAGRLHYTGTWGLLTLREIWLLITGEYPPRQGGVGDYVRQIAIALAARGDEVHVWAPESARGASADSGVELHPLPGDFTPRGLRALSRGLSRFPAPRRLFVQYVPHAYGYRAMNIPFCAWLAARRADRVWVMFHEVAFPWGRGRPLSHNVLGAVTRAMAWGVASRADQVLVSTGSWVERLRALHVRLGPVLALPIPSNLPLSLTPAEREAGRLTRPGGNGAIVLGHFGTYGASVTDVLGPALESLLLKDERRTALLLGRGGDVFMRGLAGRPGLAGRVVAPGELPPREVAARLSACDLLLQPYPDGITCRRTSAMAGIGLGLPVVTNAGELTEPLWRQLGPVALADRPDAGALAARAETLLASPEERARLGGRAREVYAEHLSIERNVEELLRLATAETAEAAGRAR